MLVALIIVAVVAAGLLGLVLTTRQRAAGLESDLERTSGELERTTGERDDLSSRLDVKGRELSELQNDHGRLKSEADRLSTEVAETNEALRKRTELADAQAMQIDTVSAERDDLRQQLAAAEERIVTLAARPGVVVGELQDSDEASAQMLWDLELTRTERLWRNSVAINPVADPSPFDATEDPVRLAVEIEASALREDVGAFITIDWQAEPIESPARRLLVVRVAQEMLATAARAPGAAKLVVTQSGDEEGDLKMEFESADDDSEVINLIPPQISNELVDVSSDTGLSVTVRSGAGG